MKDIRRARLLLGSLGIAVGLVGLANILVERRSAEKQRRVLTTLAEEFREDGTSVVWNDEIFRPGDRVRIVKWAGTFKPAETAAPFEVQAAAGRTGVIIRGEQRLETGDRRVDPEERIQIVRVRWHAQSWKRIGAGDPLRLPEFEATIHVSYLDVIR